MVRKLLQPQATDTIVDVGCGDGDVTKELPGEIHGIELLKSRVERARKNGVNCIHGSAEKLPYKDNTFNKAICSEVLEHLFYPEKAVKEIHRVLKPGGFCVFTVPINEIILSRDHLRRYTPSEFMGFLVKHGFINLAPFYSDKFVLRHRLFFPFKTIRPDLVYKKTPDKESIIVQAWVKK